MNVATGIQTGSIMLASGLRARRSNATWKRPIPRSCVNKRTVLRDIQDGKFAVGRLEAALDLLALNPDAAIIDTV